MYLNRAHRVFLAVLCLLLITSVGFTERPRVSCIQGATLVPAPGERLDNATVVLRDGLIEAVGHDVAPPADAVIIDGDILEIRTTVERVFIDGREADLATRQTELYERYAGRPIVAE